MDVLTGEDFGALVGVKAFPVVSIYLPTHRAGSEIRQDPIRLRNLVSEARRLLVDTGLRGTAADELLKPVRDLVEESIFWRYQEDGLALFCCDTGLRSFRLPVSFTEHVHVGDSFHVRPLLAVMSRGERFSVLCLSLRRVRLLWGTRFRVGEEDLGDLPVSLTETLWFEDYERQLQLHQSGIRGRGQTTTIFHGHGTGGETAGKRLERFFRAIDSGIGDRIEPGVPLILAGVDHLIPVYRKVSRHEPLLGGEITGNPEDLTDGEIHERAWDIARPFFDKEREAAASMLTNGTSAVELTIDGVLPAAAAGRVSTLFIDVAAAEWGTFENTKVERHSSHQTGDRELLDLAVAETWRHGGAVYAGIPEGIPEVSSAAAVLRY